MGTSALPLDPWARTVQSYLYGNQPPAPFSPDQIFNPPEDYGYTPVDGRTSGPSNPREQHLLLPPPPSAAMPQQPPTVTPHPSAPPPPAEAPSGPWIGGGPIGPNPGTWPGFDPGDAGTAVPSGWNQFTNHNPLEQAEQNRLAAKGWWDALEQDTIDSQNRSQNLEENYRQWLQGGPGGYARILSGEGGFSPEEQERILQRELIQNGLVSAEQLEALGLEPWEMQMILSDPYAAREIIGGMLDSLEASGHDAAGHQRAAYLALLDNLDAVAQRGGLSLSGQFDPRQMGYIGDLRGAYDRAVDPGSLGLSQEFLSRYDWTPADTERLASQAGRTVGMRGLAERDALERDAFAMGNTTPLAVAALQNENKIRSDIAAADAVTNARIAGRQNELDTTRTREQMRLDSAFGLSDRQMSAAESIAGRSLTQGEAAEVLRLQAERDRANRASDAARVGGLARLETERGIGDAAQERGRYGTNLVYDATRYGEAETSRRAGDVAQNRQRIGQYGIDTRFGQAMPASQALSDRWGGILGQRSAEEREGRSYLADQQRRAAEGAATTRQQRIGAGGTALGGINQATHAATQAHIPWTETANTIVNLIRSR